MDRYLDPPDPAPEMDGDDEERLLLDCFVEELQGKSRFDASSVRTALKGIFAESEVVYVALLAYYRTEIDERWAEERKPDPYDRADYEYERRRDDRLTEER